MSRVRIGILHQRESVFLRLPEGTRAHTDGGERNLSGEWTIRVRQPRAGLVQPALKVLESADIALVEEARARLEAAGMPVEVRQHAPGGRWGKVHVPATRLLARLLDGPEEVGSGAHMLREQALPADVPILDAIRHSLGDLTGHVAEDPALWHVQAPVRCRWTTRPAEGRLLLIGPSGEEVELDPPLRLMMPETGLADVGDVRVGIGFHWDHHETLAYEDTLEAWIEPGGHLGLVNELDLEHYLASVNSSEMTADSPFELLCAQTVAARSTLLATRGRHHAGEPFDICADDHCQCFRGSRTVRGPSRESAQATRAIVLTHEGRVCDARYSKSCGGIVEAYEHVWEDHPVPYLPSFRDTCEPDPDFTRPTTESGWRDWLLAAESVWCNTEAFVLPEGLAFSDGFYRWRVELDRAEAAAHIRRVTGRSFGCLLDLVPMERGASGRLRRLLVRTDDGDFGIGKELTIRLALSATCLYSAAIVLDWEGDRLIIRGKGWGHGVGMCQLGATHMALAGHDWRSILHHYYPKTEATPLRPSGSPRDA